jgi:hypothetical protein
VLKLIKKAILSNEVFMTVMLRRMSECLERVFIMSF